MKSIYDHLSTYTGENIGGMNISKLASRYSKEAARIAYENNYGAPDTGGVVESRFLTIAKRKIAESLEKRAESLNGNLPVISVFDALQIAKSCNDGKDMGVRNLTASLNKMWKKNRTANITAKTFLDLREYYESNYPRSKVVAAFEKMGNSGYLNLPVSDLIHIASRITDQESFEDEMRLAGLTSNRPDHVQARNFVLALINEGGSKKAQFDDDEFEEDEPQEDDIIIQPGRGQLGAGYSVFQGGKHIGDFTESYEMEDAIKEWMEKHNFYPNVWEVSDHGNISLYKMGGNRRPFRGRSGKSVRKKGQSTADWNAKVEEAKEVLYDLDPDIFKVDPLMLEKVVNLWPKWFDVRIKGTEEDSDENLQLDDIMIQVENGGLVREEGTNVWSSKAQEEGVSSIEIFDSNYTPLSEDTLQAIDYLFNNKVLDTYTLTELFGICNSKDEPEYSALMTYFDNAKGEDPRQMGFDEYQPKKKTFECPECGKILPSERGWKIHMTRVHKHRPDQLPEPEPVEAPMMEEPMIEESPIEESFVEDDAYYNKMMEKRKQDLGDSDWGVPPGTDLKEYWNSFKKKNRKNASRAEENINAVENLINSRDIPNKEFLLSQIDSARDSLFSGREEEANDLAWSIFDMLTLPDLYKEKVSNKKQAGSPGKFEGVPSELVDTAESLYDLANEGMHDREAGESATTGWYAGFDAERAIIMEDSQGFIAIEVFDNVNDYEEAWEGIEEDVSSYDEHEDDDDYEGPESIMGYEARRVSRVRAFPPAEGSDERDGWDSCLDIPGGQRSSYLKEVVKDMDTPGRREFARGWMDAYDTYKEKTWDEMKNARKRAQGLWEKIEKAVSTIYDNVYSVKPYKDNMYEIKLFSPEGDSVFAKLSDGGESLTVYGYKYGINDMGEWEEIGVVDLSDL